MSSAFKKINESLQKLTKPRSAIKAEISEIQESLIDLKRQLVDLMIQAQLQNITKIVQEIRSNQGKPADTKAEAATENAGSDISHSEALDNLEEITTSKQDNTGLRWFLLHRATEDYEYESSKQDDNWFNTDKSTEWVADYMKSEDKKQGANPTVSCWVSENDIESIPNPHLNTGTWGSLGKNPFASKYKAIVKAGKYQIYQEYRGE